MILRLATTEDVDALMALRIEAEGWLAAAGIDQWRNPRTRGPALAKWVADIEAGRTWVLEDQVVVATVTLALPDMDFWRTSDDPESAVYVAKLITARATKGRGLGSRLLDWSGSQARAQGKPWVRLDCWRDNLALQDFYMREGFAHVRTEAPTHRLSGWMGQRLASVVRHPDRLLTTSSPQFSGSKPLEG
ncbi:GNAT family N-acetyltransferase [Streptomyces sp. NBC_01789]|uniref:GNAT family N-acetyltransferase n=1 Tax=Streptomyces sp. NBC_01789 TaxID=2975941 RepID=UPI0022501DED|nr:GNAT family N-acetyltransferase [Streptomyces sp. NBC_01789]MCX4451645.1 GNAT family N-acetyltransferase [Streptomyces sp. NBC_01789]